MHPYRLTKQQFPIWFFNLNLSFESPTWRGDAFKKKMYIWNFGFFMLITRVFFQETQTGQPSDNFPWFFDLNPSFERNASRVDAFTSFIWCWNFLLFVFDVEYFSTNSNRPIKQQFPMVLWLVYILSTYCTERICFYFTSFDRRCLLFVGCFFRFRGHVQLPKLSIRNKFVMKMLFCTIIVVIMSNHIRRITLNLLCTVTCCTVQQFL